MAVIRDFSPAYQNSLTNQRHRIVQYALRFDRGPVGVIVTWPSASGITYTELLGTSTLSGGSAETPWGMAVDGSFSWAEPLTAYNAGTNNPTVIFTPDDEVRFSSVEGTIPLSVAKANPQISNWPTPGAITFGDSLAESTLVSGSANIPGTFHWTDDSEVPDSAGWHSYEVTFTPTDTDNYNTVTNMRNVNVSQASVNVTQWPTASDIDQGDELSVSTLSGGAASVAGSFTWGNPTSTPQHRQNYQVWFIPNDANYQSVSGSVQVTPWQYYVQPEQVIAGNGSGSYGLVGRYLDTNETYIIMRNKWVTGANQWQKVDGPKSIGTSWTSFTFPMPTYGKIITHIGALINNLWPSYWFYARGAFSGSVQGTGAGATSMGEERVGYAGGGVVELRHTNHGGTREVVASIWESNYLSTTNPSFNINSLNLTTLNNEWVQRSNMLVSNQVNSFTYSQSGYSDAGNGSSGEFYLRVKYKYYTLP